MRKFSLIRNASAHAKHKIYISYVDAKALTDSVTFNSLSIVCNDFVVI